MHRMSKCIALKQILINLVENLAHLFFQMDTCFTLPLIG